MNVNVSFIKEVKILWDFEYAIIPSKYVKKVVYNEIKRNSNYIYCKDILLQMDFKYLKTHGLYVNNDNKEKGNITIFEKFEHNNIWNIEIIYKTEQEGVISLLPPSNRKDNYCSEKKQCPCGMCAKNLCEHHTYNEESYIIEWKECSENEIYMNAKEMAIFFRNKNLTNIIGRNSNFGIELFDYILKLNMKDNCIIDKVNELSKTSYGANINFCNFKEDVNNIYKRIHYKNSSTGEIYGIKKGYDFSEQYYPLYGIDIFIVNAINHSHHWNFSFVLIPNLETQEDRNRIYKVIYDSVPNEGTKNYFSRCILVFNDNINLEEFMLEFYRNTYKNTNPIKVLNEKLLFVTYKDINKFWYDIHNSWDSL